MDQNITEAKREYFRQYREANKEKLAEQRREWARNNPDKVRKHQENFWRRVAEKQNALNVQ